MASKPPKKARNPLERMPTRKLASVVRRNLLKKLRGENPDWQPDKPIRKL